MHIHAHIRRLFFPPGMPLWHSSHIHQSSWPASGDVIPLRVYCSAYVLKNLVLSYL